MDMLGEHGVQEVQRVTSGALNQKNELNIAQSWPEYRLADVNHAYQIGPKLGTIPI